MGGVCFLGVLFLFKDMVNGNIPALGLLSLLASFLPIALAEIFVLKVHRRPSAGLGPGQSWNIRRVATKLAGFYITIALLWALYHFVPEYQKNFYSNFRGMFDALLPLVAAGGGIYIALLDRHLIQPEDGLHRFGRLCLMQGWKEDGSAVKAYMLSVLLRAYFIPVMAVYFFAFLANLMEGPESYLASHSDMPKDLTGIEFLKILLIGYFFFMTVDMVFAVIGYLVVFKPLDSHIRSIDATLAGWIACLICYYPFWDYLIFPLMNQGFFNNPQWFVWLGDYPILLALWGIFVVLAMCTESFTTLTFGTRFSNLTYRGVMTSGLFRFTKHPQYVSKCFNRLFVFMPFFSPAGWEGVLTGLMLFALFCFIYYVRARTEENHLARYPDYVEYANAMNERSVFRSFATLLPFLKFNKERAMTGKLF